jgi:hypothetical protein
MMSFAQFPFPFPFRRWVSSTERYRVTLRERRRLRNADADVDALIQSLSHACKGQDAAVPARSSPAAETLKNAVVRRIETELDTLADRIADRILLRLNGSPTDPEEKESTTQRAQHTSSAG